MQKKGEGGEKETNMTLVTVFSLNSFTKKLQDLKDMLEK